MRCLLGAHLVCTRNPVARTAGRFQFVLTHPVHPVKKVLSREAVASSGLDGDGTSYKRPTLRAVSTHREVGMASMRGTMRKSLISKASFTQVVDFQDRPYVTR